MVCYKYACLLKLEIAGFSYLILSRFENKYGYLRQFLRISQTINSFPIYLQMKISISEPAHILCLKQAWMSYICYIKKYFSKI